MRARHLIAAVVVAVTLPVQTADAQPVDHAQAEQHFRAARNLIRAGRCSDAIAELRRSIELEKTVGAYWNLAGCHFKMRNLDDAWREYKEAETLALSQKGDSRLDEIRADLANLERTSVRLEIVTSDGATNLTITVDGRSIPRDRLAPVLVEPSVDHVVVVYPEGKPAWGKTVRGQAGSVVRVELEGQNENSAPPRLVQRAPKADRGDAPPASAVDEGHGTRTLGLVLGGTGLAAIAAGGVFGVLALNSRQSLEDAVGSHPGCRQGSYPDASCDPGARADLDPIESRANTQATVSTILFSVGGAALVTGVVLWAVAPRRAKPVTTGHNGRWLIGPSPDPRAPYGLSLTGTL